MSLLRKGHEGPLFHSRMIRPIVGGGGRTCLAPMLFDDEEGPERPSVVAEARPSASARKKAASKHSPDGLPVHSFPTLLADLATIAKQRVQPRDAGSPPFDLVTRPTPQQEKVLGLLNLRLGRTR